ncbi:MAG TPA: hypothetical protein VNN17_10875, partial [Terriglobia bacterium]|nr:hypothetical protein [Terriglobia bacterium]
PAVLFGQDPEGFRPVGPWRGPNGALSPRDLQPPLHRRMQQVAYYLYLVNPLAHRIVEFTMNYCVGDGVTIEAEDPAVARLLQEFWHDRVNDLDHMLPESVKELGIFGEQCWLAAVNPVNGRVRLGYLDPAEIEAIEWGELRTGRIGDAAEEPLAVSVPVAVVRRAAAAGTAPRRLRIVRMEEDPDSPAYGRLTGDCFYFAINKARSASRGVSDLYAIADYLDGYDKMLFGMIDRVGFSNAFIWDVLLKGATQETVAQWLKEQRPPRPGSLRVHNEQVEWKAVAPNLGASDFNEAARVIKNMNLAGAGFPEHWFAEGGNVNRATALEMGEPTLRTLLQRQGYVASMLRAVLDFVIDQAVAAGTLPETASRRYTVQMPEMSIRQFGQAAQAVAQVSTAVVELRKAGLIDRQTAQRMVERVALQLGVEMDLSDMARRLEEEKAEGARQETK